MLQVLNLDPAHLGVDAVQQIVIKHYKYFRKSWAVVKICMTQPGGVWSIQYLFRP